MRQRRTSDVVSLLLMVTPWIGVACSGIEEGGRASGESDASAETSADAPTALDVTPGSVGEAALCAPSLGLYADAECDTLNVGIKRFKPQFPLWSDGSSKRRFAYIPPGTTVDVSDPDRWVFPVGSRFWKHFETPGGLRLETRVIEKVSDRLGVEGWAFETWVWNAAGDDVTRVTDGLENVLGTGHDIPAIEDCSECHSGGDNQWDSSPGQDELLDVPLGFGAIQLNHQGSDTTLGGLFADGWLSEEVALSSAQVPGDDVARAALGYLHGNCGSCHGGASPAKDLTMLLHVGTTHVEDTPTFKGNVGVPTKPNKRATGVEDMPATRIVPGDPDNSALVWRMRQRSDGEDDAQMPPLATEVVDHEAVEAIAAWIRSL
jgi:mono/diheme cytochrome c family protein